MFHAATSFIQDLSNWIELTTSDRNRAYLLEVHARYTRVRARCNLRKWRVLFWAQRFTWWWRARAWAPGHAGYLQAIEEWNALAA